MGFIMFNFILFASLFPVLAYASDFSCLLTESSGNQDFESSFMISLDPQGNGNYQIQKSAGGLTSANLQVQNSHSTWTMMDPSTGKPLTTFFSAKEGTSSRIQIIPSTDHNDYILLDCGRGESAPPQEKPTSFACLLSEKTSIAQLEHSFTVPVASSGHDIFPLPKAQISPLGGWVLAYNGMIAIFLQNQNTYSGITALGSWDSEIDVSWYPSSDETQVSLICRPQ